MKKLIALSLMLLASMQLFAQDKSDELMTGLRSQGKIFVVVGVVAIIWIGFGIYLFSIDRRLSKLEKNKKS